MIQGVLGAGEFAPQTIDFAMTAQHGRGRHEQSEGHSQDEGGQHHDDQRDLSEDVIGEQADIHRRCVLQGEKQHDDKDHQPQNPDQIAHATSSSGQSNYCKRKAPPRRS